MKNRKWTRLETRVWEFSGVKPADQRSFGRLVMLAIITLVIVWGDQMTNMACLVVALTIWSEARGEGEKGMRAVGSVIWARAGSPWNLVKVCQAPKQFSCWNGKKAIKLDWTEEKSFDVATRIAQELLDGKFKPTIMATYYHALSVNPRWNRGMEHITTIGNHKFWLERERKKK